MINEMEPSLWQGYQYLRKDRYKQNTRESMQNQNQSSCSSATNLEPLLAKYQKLLNEIQTYEDQYKEQTNNVYLNKNIFFSDGTYAYVTKAGIVKKYANLAMMQKNANQNGCPPPVSMSVKVPWVADYDLPGASIQMPSSTENSKGPILKTGSPMVLGQSCGFEGSDVMVSQENDTPISRYIGCYDNPAGIYPAATSYINQYLLSQYAEPYTNFVANGDFEYGSVSSKDFSNKSITATNQVVASWKPTTTATLVQSSNTDTSQLSYPKPYPNNNDKCVSLNGTQDISQTINSSLSAGTYKLVLSACGSNPLNILVNKVSIFAGDNYLVPTSAWAKYSYDITLKEATTNLILSFAGTDTTNGSTKNTAITAIRFTNGTQSSTKTTLTFEQCQNLAQTKKFPYFGFQKNPTATDGTGYCFYNSDATGSFLSSLTSSSKLSPLKILSSGTTTAPNIGVAAGLTNTGILVVYTSVVSKNATTVPVSTNKGLPSNTVNKPYLLLSDDGIMRIYAGGDPVQNKQGDLIWSSLAPSVQPIPNPDFAANKGLNGYNFLKPGNILSPGQFIGSPSGAAYLKMESTGDLVLYTSSYSGSCSKNASTNVMEGSLTSAALYKTNTATDNLFTYLGKLFFVSPDAKLQNFGADTVQMSNKYQKIPNYNNPGTSFNLDGDMSSFNTLDKCKAACDVKTNCYGYSYASATNSCQLKGSNINADLGGPAVQGTDLYVRQQQRKTSTSNFNVSNTRMQNYVKGQTYSSKDEPNISSVLEAKRQELSQLQEEINTAVDQLKQCSATNDTYNLDTILDKINKAKADIQTKQTAAGKGQTPNLDNMIEDTSLKVIQDSNKYMAWGVVAAATILISIGVSKL